MASKLGGDVYVVVGEKMIFDADGKSVNFFFWREKTIMVQFYIHIQYMKEDFLFFLLLPAQQHYQSQENLVMDWM